MVGLFLFLFYRSPVISLWTLPLTTITGPNYLTPPDKGLVLSHVVLGRGTQNYTCVDATDASVPVAQGAVADLYDVSCLAAKRPELLHLLPDVMVNIGKTTIETAASIVSRMTRDKLFIGHHYFAPNNTIPVFDFRMEKSQSLIFRGKKDQGVPATIAASKGIPTEQNGAVDWLRIVAIQSMSVGVKLVYRVQTAGGKSPSTCKGMPKSFEIQYATEYCKYSHDTISISPVKANSF